MIGAEFHVADGIVIIVPVLDGGSAGCGLQSGQYTAHIVVHVGGGDTVAKALAGQMTECIHAVRLPDECA